MPGFSIIKNKVIKPLLVASERIVEQMMPDVEEEKNTQKPKLDPEYEMSSKGDNTTKVDSVSMVSGEDGDERRFRKQMHKLNIQDEECEFFEMPDKAP